MGWTWSSEKDANPIIRGSDSKCRPGLLKHIWCWSFVSIILFVANCDSFSPCRSLALQHPKGTFNCAPFIIFALVGIASNISFISYGLRALWIAVLFSWPLKNTIAIGETIIRQGSLCHFCHFCRLAIIRRSQRVPFVALSSTMRGLMTVRSERVQLPFVLLPFDILNVLYLWRSLYSP